MSLNYKISEVALKLQLDDYLASAERFKALDQNLVPLELDQLRSSYQHILQKLSRACNQACKYRHLAETYRDQLNFEVQSITNLEKEIDEFEQACCKERESAKACIQEIRNYNTEFFHFLQEQHEPPRDILLAFQAFLQLGPEGTMGAADLSWDAVKKLMVDQNKLADMMDSLFETRLKDVSRAEIECARETMSHFNKEYSLRQEFKGQPLSKIMAKYNWACLAYWDFQEAIQARVEMEQLKKDKMDYIKKEMKAYEAITEMYEKEVDEIYMKYHHSKEEYEGVRKEAVKADEALKKFEEHYRQLEQERSKDHRNLKRINDLMQEMRKDCDEFDHLREKIRYKLPGEVEQA